MNAIKQLETEFENDKLTHAYLFIGGDETEKNNIIDLFSLKKKCFPEDISVVVSSDETGRGGEIKIEAIRELIHTIYLTPNGPARLAIIHNCERLNQSSGNTLLKSLEEPPSYLTFILFAASDSVLSTIRSRCRIVYLSEITTNEKSKNSSLKEIFGDGFFEASTKIEKTIKDDQVKDFFEEIGIYLREKMLQSKSANSAIALEELEAAKGLVHSNANVRLVLECLYLKLKEIE